MVIPWSHRTVTAPPAITHTVIQGPETGRRTHGTAQATAAVHDTHIDRRQTTHTSHVLTAHVMAHARSVLHDTQRLCGNS
jgi:hypothetical protein